jgi:hypothetical protein
MMMLVKSEVTGMQTERDGITDTPAMAKLTVL